MRNIPVDTSRLSVAFIDAVPVPERDRDSGTLIQGRQAADRDGVPSWYVNTLCIVEGEDGGETVRVRVSADSAPAFEPLARIEFEGLTARGWSQDGRSGISYSATAVKPAGSTNGRTRQAAPAEVAS